MLKAGAGSTHGYDVTDPTVLNPELGTDEDFEALCGELRARGMGLVLDVVPNHMATGQENPWWMDVLENGAASRYAGYFDIDWTAPALEGKVLVPVLGDPYAEVLEAGELRLELRNGALLISYHDHRFPLDPATYGAVLADRVEELEGPDRAMRSYRRLLADVGRIPPRTRTGRAAVERRARAGESVRRRLAELCRTWPEVRRFVEARVAAWGGNPGARGGGEPGETALDRLDRLVAMQAYLLSYWRAAVQEIDYRRFFDINELVAMRTQDPAVFDATHGLVLRLVERGLVTGLRIDHVDGLQDPQGYTARLRDRLGASGGAYVVVEKVLATGETLPAEWPVAGTTGYDFLDAVNGVLADMPGVVGLGLAHAELTGIMVPFDEIAADAKRAAMERLFGSETEALGTRLQLLARQDRHGRDLTAQDLTRALVEVTAALRVYRTYVRGPEVGPADRRRITDAVAAARTRTPPEARGALDFLERVLLLDLPATARPSRRAREWLAFVLRWQQLTPPVMAKGVEDNAMYVDNRLVSRNDVGVDPALPGLDVKGFHRRMRARAGAWPHTMNATSTHDTKRSEDARARIDVLSEIPERWLERLHSWMRTNAGRRVEVDGRTAPDRGEELMIYQNLLGIWPLDRGEEAGLADRMATFATKALREARVHTTWVDPNEAWERAVQGFVRGILSGDPAAVRFRRDFAPFAGEVAFHGALNALTQVVAKAAAPGVPDLYQGTELWSFSLVDPDNRHPVDFGLRAEALRELRRPRDEDRDALLHDLLGTWRDGRIKLFATNVALELRQARPEVFRSGSYVALEATGAEAESVLAFARRRAGGWVLAAGPRLSTRLTEPERFPLGRQAWGRTAMVLPKGAPGTWRDAFTGRPVEAVPGTGGRPTLRLADLMAAFPVALLEGGAPRAPGAPRPRASTPRGGRRLRPDVRPA